MRLLKSFKSKLILIASIIAVFVIFYKTSLIPSEEHNIVIDNYIQLKKNQMEQKQIILKINLNKNSNFDKLINLQKKQNMLAQKIKSDVTKILNNNSSLAIEHIDQYLISEIKNSSLVESFVRSSAILKNSTNYFIYLSRDFINFLNNETNAIKEANIVKRILSDTLILALNLDNNATISNNKNTLLLSNILKDLSIPSESNYSFLPKHLEKIIDNTKITSENIQDIFSANAETHIEISFSSYLKEFDKLQNEKKLYSNFLITIVSFITIFTAFYISFLKKSEGNLLEEVNKLSGAMKQSHDAVMIVNANKNIEYINPAFTKITGYTIEETLDNTVKLLRSENTPSETFADLWKTIKEGGIWSGNIQKKRKNGELYWASESISPIFDPNGNITNYLSTHRDITEQHILNEQITFQASHDALTGLVNRRKFEQRAEQLISTVNTNNKTHAICFMDLDQFKIVNDTCGHIAGDELLRQLGLMLKNSMRQRDLLARLGGDEFGILIEDCSLDNAYKIAKSLQRLVQNYQFSWEGRNFKVGVSIGLVAITESTPNLSELFKNADASCYIAKEMGRNRIHIYNENDIEIAERQGQIQWVTRINKAFEQNCFCLFAQAIVPLDNSSDIHYELLIRMLDKDGNTIPPGAFLPTAERYNMITSIDRWVITNAFALLLEHEVFLNKVNFISINLSGQSLAEPEFLDFVFNQFATTQLPPEKICFEITETAAISNLNTATLFISKMKKLGSKFALDDFGSGLSSFGYLKKLPVDFLKIDGMFVKNIVDDPIDYAMVKSINEIGHIMGMKTIAEFVENDEIKNMLNDIGINYAQGYGVGKPQPLALLLADSLESKEGSS